MVIPVLPSQSTAIIWNRWFHFCKKQTTQGCKILLRWSYHEDHDPQSLTKQRRSCVLPILLRRPHQGWPSSMPNAQHFGNMWVVRLQTFNSGSQISHQNLKYPQVGISWNHSWTQRSAQHRKHGKLSYRVKRSLEDRLSLPRHGAHPWAAVTIQNWVPRKTLKSKYKRANL